LADDLAAVIGLCILSKKMDEVESAVREGLLPLLRKLRETGKVLTREWGAIH
jgi:hypothetical protein